jgi:hypothetical protein
MKTALVGIVCALIGLYSGAIWGMKSGAFSAALEENKVAANLLSNSSLELSSELTEYLKGRIYYNIASKYPNDRGYLLRKDWDFGEVQPTQLPPKSFAKDPTFDCSSFDDATRRLTKAQSGRRETLTPDPHTTGHTDP